MNKYFELAISWWKERSRKEQQMLLWGSLSAELLIYIFFIFFPIHNGVTALAEKVQRNRNLLVWMKKAGVEISELQKTTKIPEFTIGVSLLAVIEKSIKDTSISASVGEIKQLENNNIVQVKFKNVSYAGLIRWLEKIQTESNVNIEKARLLRSDKSGVIQATIDLSR